MQYFLSAAAMLLTGTMVAKADDAKPVQPSPDPVVAAQITRLEEEIESLKLRCKVKKAYVKVAEIRVLIAEMEYKRLLELLKSATISGDLVAEVELKVAEAKAQVEIHAGELEEVELKLKYAKKRLEVVKAGGVQTVPDK